MSQLTFFLETDLQYNPLRCVFSADPSNGLFTCTDANNDTLFLDVCSGLLAPNGTPVTSNDVFFGSAGDTNCEVVAFQAVPAC